MNVNMHRSRAKAPATTLVIMLLAMFTVAASGPEDRKPWKVPKRALRLKNKVKATPASIAIGKKLYMRECASCHGKDGRGKGSAAKDLEVKPADHTNPKMRDEPDGSLFWKIRVGRNPMPSFRDKFSKKQIWHIVNYVRTLHAAGKGQASQKKSSAVPEGSKSPTKPVEKAGEN